MSESESVSAPPGIVRSVGALQSKTFDLAIIGGGLTGASIAHYAASAGLSVALLEAHDFASGRSSETSSLIYSGLSPLASNSIKQVKQSTLDAQYWHQLFPHLVTPRTIAVPLRNRWQWWKAKFGASFREVLSQVADNERHVSWDAGQIQDLETMVDTNRFPYALSFREYLRDDARLTVAMLRAANSSGAECSNYVRVESIERRRDQYFLHSTDELAGATLAVRCRCVVNATGVWSQQVLAGDVPPSEMAADLSVDAKEIIKAEVKGDAAHRENEPSLAQENQSFAPSKSVYIAVPHQRFPLNHMTLMNASDRRAVFAVPHGQVTYIGAREVPYERMMGRRPEVEIEDIQYLLAPATDYFPDLRLDPADVVSSWASFDSALTGLPAKQEVGANEAGVITVLGGSFTGLRSLASMTLEQVSQTLNREIIFSDADTAPGSGIETGSFDAEVTRISAQFQIDALGARRLVGLYGSEVCLVLGNSPRRISRRVFEEEVEWAITKEGAIALDDVLYRRLRVAWFEPRALAELLPLVADRMAEILGWDASEHLRQRVNAESLLAADLAAIPLGG